MKTQSLFPRIVVVQIAIAVVAVAVLLLTVSETRNLVAENARLDSEIDGKQAELQTIERESKELTERVDSLKLLAESVIQEIDSSGQFTSKVSDLPWSSEGKVIVLASYKSLDNAVLGIDTLRKQGFDDVKLYFAINNYYAAVLGVFDDEAEADAALKHTTPVVPDAYPFGAWAFLYEIKLELP